MGVRLVAVIRIALSLAGPETEPVASHWPPPFADRSREKEPPNASSMA
jgi:hypothetical protein